MRSILAALLICISGCAAGPQIPLTTVPQSTTVRTVIRVCGSPTETGSLTASADHAEDEAGQTASLHGAVNIQIGQIWVDTSGNVKPTMTGNDIRDSGNPHIPVDISATH